MKKIIISCLIILPVSVLKAQQIPNLSQYTLNHYAINPAAAGSSEKIPIAFTYRKLWAGIDGSPSVQYLSAHSLVRNDMGVGMKVFGYQAGPLKKTGFEATYSYHLLLNPEGTKLAFGLTGQVYQFCLNKSDLTIEDPDDEVFLGEEKMIVPDASFGLYLYNKKYFAGLSIPQLIGRNIDLKSDKVLQQKQVRHYYLHGGVQFELSNVFSFEPSLLLKFIEAGLFQADINTRFIYNDMLLFGLSYRTADAMVVQVGYKNKDFIFGYSYDIGTGGLSTQSSGSHEIILMYSLNNFLYTRNSQKYLEEE